MPSLLSFAHLLSLTLHKHKHLCYPFSEFRKRSVVSRYFSSFSFIIRLTQFLFAQTESIMISLEYITSPFLNNSKDALLPLGQMVWKSNIIIFKSNMVNYINWSPFTVLRWHCLAVHAHTEIKPIDFRQKVFESSDQLFMSISSQPSSAKRFYLSTFNSRFGSYDNRVRQRIRQGNRWTHPPFTNIISVLAILTKLQWPQVSRSGFINTNSRVEKKIRIQRIVSNYRKSINFNFWNSRIRTLEVDVFRSILNAKRDVKRKGKRINSKVLS